MTFELHGIHRPEDVGLTDKLLDPSPFLVETLPDKPMGLLVDLSNERLAVLEEPSILLWRRGLPTPSGSALLVFAQHTDGLLYLGEASVEYTTGSKARIALDEAVPAPLAKTLKTKRAPVRAPRAQAKTGILAIVSKAIFEREAKRGETKRGLGDVLDIDRYVSRGPALAPLRDGATLVLVTVRPPTEDIWLVAILDDLSLTDDGYIAKKANRIPLTDVTTLVKELLAEGGSPLKPGKIAMSLQTPRSLGVKALARVRAVHPIEEDAEREEEKEAPKEATSAKITEAFAPSVALPRVLVTPPWTTGKARRPTAKAKAYEADLATIPTRIVWGKHERELALGVARVRGYQQLTLLKTAADLDEPAPKKFSVRSFSTMPLEEARKVARRARPDQFQLETRFLLPALARLDEDIVPFILAVAMETNTGYGSFDAIAHIGTPLAVPIVVQTFSRTPSLRRATRSWLTRFADLAAHALVPLAAGVSPEAIGLANLYPQKRDTLRSTSARALAFIRDDERVMEIAKQIGLAEEAEAALAIHPLAGRAPPSRIPWHTGLPRARLKNGPPLGDQAMVNLVTLLALTDWESPTDDVLELSQSLDLVELLDGLVGDWLAEGALADGRFTLDAACQLADGALLEKIVDLIRSWRSMYRFSSPHAIATIGRAAIARAGTLAGARALEQLGALSVRSGSADRERAANEALKEVASALEMGDEALEDARIPRLGLDAQGRIELVAGGRKVFARLDATLAPYLVDAETNERLSELPRGARRGMRAVESDEERDAERFASLRKEAAHLAEELGPRARAWMTERRRWTVAGFRERVLEHPVLRDLAGGLVWGTYAGTLQRTFRVSEDGSFADEHDESFTPDPEALIGVVHPAELDEALLRKWGDLLADYQIIPMFPQLATPVLRLSDDERSALVLQRYAGKGIGYEEMRGLRFWRDEQIPDTPFASIAKKVERHGDGAPLRAIMLLDRQFVSGKRALKEVRVLPYSAIDFEGYLPWSVVDPVSVSEVLGDLERAFGTS